MELLVRVSIWVSVVLWAIAVALRITGRNRDRARVFWTAGVAVYAAHVVTAFQGYYGWSHATALAETARQTRETTGWESGAGLWLNYLFGLIWLADTIFWWARGHARYFGRSRRVAAFVHGFFVFMIFNGTVVFASGAARWLGIGIFAGLGLLWFRARRVSETRRLR